MEVYEGRPYNPNVDYGTCTCAKNGCDCKIRYPVKNMHWRPKYCRGHMKDEAMRLVTSGMSEREAFEALHVQMKGLEFHTIQESIS